MQTILQFAVDNGPAILGFIGAAHVLALAIVNTTKTPNGVKYVETVYKAVEFVAGVVTAKAKQ